MPNEFMINKKVKYTQAGPSEVPYPNYRCKSTSIKPARLKDGVKTSVETKHPCRIVIDHPGDHYCLCGHRWEPGTTKERVS